MERREAIKDIIEAIKSAGDTQEVEAVLDGLGVSDVELHYVLVREDLLVKDAVLKVEGHYIPLRWIWDWVSKRQKRSRADEHELVSVNQLTGEEIPIGHTLTEDDRKNAVKAMSPRKDKSAGGHRIVRTNLLKVAQELDKILSHANPDTEDLDNPLSFQEHRYSIIEALINWRLKFRESIDATYTPKNIRDLLDNTDRKHQ